MGLDPEDYRIAMAQQEERRGRRRDGAVLTPPRRVAPTRKERDIQRAILDAAKLWRGVRLWKTGGGLLPLADGRRVRMGVVGVSDLVGWVSMCMLMSCHAAVRGCRAPGHLLARFVAVEVKTEKKFPTPAQQAFLDAVNAAGGIGIVARNVGDVRRGLGL